MISNQVLQNTLEGLKEISRTEFCIIDTEGKVLATTFADFSIQPGDIQAFVESQADSQLVKGFQYFKVCDDYQLEYVLVAHGDDEDTYMVGKLVAFQIQNLIVCVTLTERSLQKAELPRRPLWNVSDTKILKSQWNVMSTIRRKCRMKLWHFLRLP